MIEIKNKERCSGCTACKSICPKNAIEMKEDEEGFKYPSVNIEKCINCGLCKKVCPVTKNKEINKSEISSKAYAMRVNDYDVLKKSTSGGFFTPLSNYVLNNNGVVFGVGYDKNMNVIHKKIEKNTDINQVIGSKYVQSELGETFKIIKKYLDKNVMVLFSGTPCQVAGLKSFLVKKYNNLITLDVVCHGTPSPKLWKDYIEFQERKYNSRVKNAFFRNKTYGYHSGTMKIIFENGKEYYGSARVDFMLRSFFNEISSRPSCYKCAFKTRTHCSDFTVFDSWHIDKIVKGLKDDDKGYTNVLINSNKGIEIFNKLENIVKYEADIDEIIKLDGSMVENSKKPNKYRNEFYDSLNNIGIERTIDKYLKIKLTDYILEKSKVLLYKFNIIYFLNKIKKKIKL